MQKVFHIHQAIFTTIGIYPPASGTNFFQLILYKIIRLSIPGLLACCAAASILFVFRNLLIDFESCIYAGFQVAATGTGLLKFSATWICRKKLQTIFDHFQNIYDTSRF